MAGGIRFDISSLIILNSVYILMMTLPLPIRNKRYWQKPANIYYYIVNILAFSLNIIDTVYFRFTSKRMTADIFSFIETGEEDLMGLLPRFIYDFALEILAWIMLSAIFVWIASRIRTRSAQLPGSLRFYLLNTLAFLVVGYISVIGIRGGFQLRPITIINAGSYANAKNVSLVLNTPFSIIKSYGHTGLEEVNYFPDETALVEIFDPLHLPKNDTLAFKDYNIILIIMESFGTEYIGSLNKNDEVTSYTPNLDSIIGQGLAFKAYANGKQSMEALPAIVAGIPSLLTRPYITSAYGSNRINSLAGLLSDKGYTTSFFHGGRNGTMGFESFARMAGYHEYYGKDEYGNDTDFDGNWGIYDGPFFEFFKRELGNMKQPFMSTLFSLSSHHPFMVPDEYAGRFDKGTLDIHESIMYSDHVLGEFFRSVSDAKWFNNTLFIITADHTSLSSNEIYQTRSGIYAVPIVFYMQGKIEAGLSDDVAQHADIMGSVLSFLKYDKPYISFGNDLFDPDGKRFSVNFLNNSYQLIMDGWSLHYDGRHATGLFKLGETRPENVIDGNREISNKMEILLKAIVQQYNHRIIHNKMTVDGTYE
jgi:phosphoglycerol transferase MdoB-like AlkP superfamily enzyme